MTKVQARTVLAGVKDVLSSKAYDAAYAREIVNEYPVVDTFEQRMGYALERNKLERAARVLACPLKTNPPNWQHGRMLYALARNYCQHQIDVSILDIGTAKGFSALCLLWALRDADILGTVTSVDVLDPQARVRRNTVAEVDGYQTLTETLAPWPEAHAIRFKKRTGLEELCDGRSRIHVCFIDGKHDATVVQNEGYMLAQRQMVGDVAVFDDVHIDGVWSAVKNLKPQYEIEKIQILPNRAYALGVRRG
jgi:predicted O-methyltransferase YrrM